MSLTRAAFAAVPVLCYLCSWVSLDSAQAGVHERANSATIVAREKFFGAENVDPSSGDVREDKVIFSWLTNASLAVSIRGRTVLLDTYINRLEVAPPPEETDFRRSPISVQDLVNLHPEAIFLGHGHGDHADNAAYLAKWLNIPIYSSPETCDVMQVDVQRMAIDPNAANGGVKIIPNGNPVKCIPLVTRSSVPGTEVVTVDQLKPVAGIIAFKHIHSGTVPTDPAFPFVPVNNSSDSRESEIYPVGLCVTPAAPNGLQCGSGNSTLVNPVAGQENLTTTGFGNIPGSLGGSICLFYQFIVCDKSNFAFVWHNTTGPLKEGVGSDPGLPSPAVGAHLFAIMDSLPQTDIEFGSIVSAGFATNGTRDPVMYQQHIKPQIYVPLHMTNVAALSSSLEFKKTYLRTLDAENVAHRPEIRWIVDPDDYLRAMVYDPEDSRWFNPDKRRRMKQAGVCR